MSFCYFAFLKVPSHQKYINILWCNLGYPHSFISLGPLALLRKIDWVILTKLNLYAEQPEPPPPPCRIFGAGAAKAYRKFIICLLSDERKEWSDRDGGFGRAVSCNKKKKIPVMQCRRSQGRQVNSNLTKRHDLVSWCARSMSVHTSVYPSLVWCGSTGKL